MTEDRLWLEAEGRYGGRDWTGAWYDAERSEYFLEQFCSGEIEAEHEKALIVYTPAEATALRDHLNRFLAAVLEVES